MSKLEKNKLVNAPINTFKIIHKTIDTSSSVFQSDIYFYIEIFFSLKVRIILILYAAVLAGVSPAKILPGCETTGVSDSHDHLNCSPPLHKEASST